MKLLYHLYLAILLEICGMEAIALSDRKRLTKYMIENYAHVGINGVPLIDNNSTLNLTFSLAPIQILKMDEDRQTISALIWYKMGWKDPLLSWVPADFGNIQKIHIPSSKIFTPDMMTYSELPGETIIKKTSTVVSPDGSVFWVPPVQLTTLCPGLSHGVKEVTCEIKFGSWTHSDKLIALIENENYIDLEYFVPNAQWELMDTSVKRNVNYYDCCPEGYTHLDYSFQLHRVSGSAAGSPQFAVPLLLACVLKLFL